MSRCEKEGLPYLFKLRQTKNVRRFNPAVMVSWLCPGSKSWMTGLFTSMRCW